MALPLSPAALLAGGNGTWPLVGSKKGSEGRRKRSCPEEGRLLEPGGFECSMRLCLAGGGGGGRDGGRASKASSPAFQEGALLTVELH